MDILAGFSCSLASELVMRALAAVMDLSGFSLHALLSIVTGAVRLFVASAVLFIPVCVYRVVMENDSG